MVNQVTVEKEAIRKVVKTSVMRLVCPFSHFTEEMVCRGEKCQIWDRKRGHCQIENLGEILFYVGGGV